MGIQADDAERARRQGLRIAVAVAVSFSWAVAQGDVIPFLGPLFAAQFLTSSRRPIGLPQAVGLIVLIIVVGQAFVLITSLLGERPLALLLLGLTYFACFFAQASGKGGAAPTLVLTIAVTVPLVGILQQDLGESASLLLARAALNGVVFTWLAHAALPDPGRDGEGAASTLAPHSIPHPRATGIALANTVILVGSVALCLVRSGLSTAIVLPLTVASLLNQLDLVTGKRTAFGLMLVNLLGGIIASLAFAILELRPEPIFLILFGLGVSPLPASSPEAFSTRIGYVLAAILYAVVMAALLWPRLPEHQGGLP
jgi:hypothetical protein